MNINGYLAVQCEAIAERATGENTVLESLCDLVTEKANCSEADFDTYVSTESLLPNKMGRQIASSLPQTGKVTVYQAGDILISNIRPYFKKIWYADQAGTCSGDVLVFRAKQPEWAGYLYSCLRNDSFFDFVMKGAKGTKMPRGDKKQMLTYEVSASPNQLVIGFMASALKHISTANKESEHLAALRDALLPKLMSGEVDVSKVNLTQLNSHLAQIRQLGSVLVNIHMLDEIPAAERCGNLAAQLALLPVMYTRSPASDIRRASFSHLKHSAARRGNNSRDHRSAYFVLADFVEYTGQFSVSFVQYTRQLSV